MPEQSVGPSALPPHAQEALDLVLREAPVGHVVRLAEDREYNDEDPLPMPWLDTSGSMLHVDGTTSPALVVAIADTLQGMVIEGQL